MPLPQNALLSVFHKEPEADEEPFMGITDFARELIALGWTLYASGGTATHLTKAGIAVIDVATMVGPVMLNHKVVTLSREVAAGLLADPDDWEESEEMKQRGLPIFGLVCVDLYPIEKAINAEDRTRDSVRAKTDVGGPTMLHAGAKGRRIMVSHPDQRPTAITWLKAGMLDYDDFVSTWVVQAEYVAAEHLMLSADFQDSIL